MWRGFVGYGCYNSASITLMTLEVQYRSHFSFTSHPFVSVTHLLIFIFVTNRVILQRCLGCCWTTIFVVIMADTSAMACCVSKCFILGKESCTEVVLLVFSCFTEVSTFSFGPQVFFLQFLGRNTKGHKCDKCWNTASV